MDQLIKIINTIGTIVPVLLAVGAGWKYLPVVRNITNEVIPLLNALIAFLMAFGGGVATAHAGLLGDIGKALSLPGQMALSVLLSYLTSMIHDKFMKGLTPPSPAK
jgi:hypothetical protein